MGFVVNSGDVPDCVQLPRLDRTILRSIACCLMTGWVCLFIGDDLLSKLVSSSSLLYFCVNSFTSFESLEFVWWFAGRFFSVKEAFEVDRSTGVIICLVKGTDRTGSSYAYAGIAGLKDVR